MHISLLDYVARCHQCWGGAGVASMGRAQPLPARLSTGQRPIRHPRVVRWKQALHWQLVRVQVPHYQTVKPHGPRTSIHRPRCRGQIEPGYRQHRIIESQNGKGWKEPQRSSGSNAPAMSRDILH